MISVIKRQISVSRFYKFIFWLVIAAMLGLWSLPGLLKKNAGREEVAWGTINGRTVLRDDFQRKVVAYEEQLNMMRAQYGQYADQLMESMGMIANPTLLAYDALVRETLLNDVAQELHMEVHPEYIKQTLGNILTSYQELSDVIPMEAIDVRNGSIHEQALRKHLRRLGLSMADFDEKVEQALKRKMVGNLIVSAAYAPNFELHNEYSMRYLPKTFSVMMIPKSEIVAEVKKDVITDKDLQAFFERKNAQNQRYWVPAKRSVRVWTITPQSYGVTVSDTEINRYYEENKEKKFVSELPKVQVRKLFLKAEKPADMDATLEKAKKLRQQLVAQPAEFAAQAKALSADANGGLMKPFAKGDTSIDPKMERASFLLKNKDDISEPVVVKDGVVLVQLVEKTPKAYKALSSVRKEILDALTQQKFAKSFVQDMKQAYKDKNDAKLKEIIAQKGGSPVVKELITNDGSALAQAAFAIPVNDYTFYVDNQEGHVTQVTDIQDRHLPTLDLVREKVKNDLIEERVALLLRSRLQQARRETQTQSFADVAKNYKAHVKKAGAVDANNADQLATLRKEGLPVDSMLQIEKVGMVEVAMDDSHGYIVRLDEIAPFKQEDFEGKRQSLTDQLGRARKMSVAQGFVASLHRNATINLNS